MAELCPGVSCQICVSALWALLSCAVPSFWSLRRSHLFLWVLRGGEEAEWAQHVLSRENLVDPEVPGWPSLGQLWIQVSQWHSGDPALHTLRPELALYQPVVQPPDLGGL